nr:hypothetical protein Iba_chr02dCG14160 [Ipomoea batatas]
MSSWRVETWSLRRLRADSVVAVAVLTEEDQRSAGAGQVQACSSDGQPSACFRDRSTISAKKLTANWRRRAAEQAGAGDGQHSLIPLILLQFCLNWGRSSVANLCGSQTTKLFLEAPQAIMASVLGSSTIANVLLKNGGGPPTPFTPSIDLNPPFPPSSHSSTTTTSASTFTLTPPPPIPELSATISGGAKRPSARFSIS